MIPGETILSEASNVCEDCGVTLVFQVLRSAAGYYIGTACKCGPYSRKSGYYPTREAAARELDSFFPS
jgi:hypothetical protein